MVSPWIVCSHLVKQCPKPVAAMVALDIVAIGAHVMGLRLVYVLVQGLRQTSSDWIATGEVFESAGPFVVLTVQLSGCFLVHAVCAYTSGRLSLKYSRRIAHGLLRGKEVDRASGQYVGRFFDLHFRIILPVAGVSVLGVLMLVFFPVITLVVFALLMVGASFQRKNNSAIVRCSEELGGGDDVESEAGGPLNERTLTLFFERLDYFDRSRFMVNVVVALIFGVVSERGINHAQWLVPL